MFFATATAAPLWPLFLLGFGLLISCAITLAAVISFFVGIFRVDPLEKARREYLMKKYTGQLKDSDDEE